MKPYMMVESVTIQLKATELHSHVALFIELCKVAVAFRSG